MFIGEMKWNLVMEELKEGVLFIDELRENLYNG